MYSFWGCLVSIIAGFAVIALDIPSINGEITGYFYFEYIKSAKTQAISVSLCCGAPVDPLGTSDAGLRWAMEILMPSSEHPIKQDLWQL